MAELRDIVARILTKNGAVCGGGFLAPPLRGGSSTHVITCAHVVNAALGPDHDNSSDRPEDKVRLPGSSKAVWGDVVEWHPPRRYDELDKEPVSDIAVLNIGESAGESGSLMARVAPSNGSRFRAFGFPGNWEQGMPTDGEVLERDNGGWLHVRAIADPDYFVEEGFSGTPVLALDDDGEVFGIITAISSEPDKKRAFVIPPDILQRAWPLLAQPYRGLSAFDKEDEDDFFGRDRFSDLLLERVRSQNVVPIFGASGSGKSSVVFAGLLPRVRRLGWPVARFRPGDRPLHALAHALAPFLEPNGSPAVRIKCARDWARLLGNDTKAIRDVAAAIAQDQPDRPLLLIADQFEELFTLCTDEAELTGFADVVHEIALAHPQPAALRLVATVRADFSGNVSGHSILGPSFHGRWLDLPAMDKWQIAEAITKPASQFGVRFETGLSETILSTVLRGVGLLPLMEFALDQLWQKQVGRCLRVADYEAMGGLEGALARHADDALSKLADLGHTEQQVRRALLHLVRVALPGEGEDTKRQQSRTELGEELWPIIRALADARLVVTSRDPAGNETADIVHEALIRNWGRLREWLDVDRKFLLWRQITEAHAKRWLELRKTPDLLLGASLLQEAKDWQRREPGRIPELVENLISESRAALEWERARTEVDEIWDSLELHHLPLSRQELSVGSWRLNPPLPRQELLALWRLVEASPSTKRDFIEAIGRSEARARKLVRRSAMVVRAAVGLDRKLSQEISQVLKAILLREDACTDVVTASIMVARELSSSPAVAEFLVLDTNQAEAVLATVLRAVEATTDLDQLPALGQTAVALAETLSPLHAKVAAEALMARVRRAVEATTNLDQLRAVQETAVALGETLPASQAELVMVAVRRAIKGVTDPYQLEALVATAVALAGKLPTAQVVEATEAVLAAVLRTVESATKQNLQALGETAAALAEKVSARTKQDAATLLLVKLPELGDQYAAEETARLVHEALRDADDEAFVRGLLDLMRFPTTTGPATDFVLWCLRQNFPTLDRPNLHLWDVIAWAEATFPGIDLFGPPHLPPGADHVFA